MKTEITNQLQAFARGKKTELKKGGRAVIYQRVSSKEQEYGFSPEVQLDVCQQWAERNDFEVVKIFEGEHESAKTDVNRKRFNEMLKFVKAKRNKIDAVIVYSTSRFSRSGTNSFTILDELSALGITVYSASSSYDARTPDGEMMQGFELVQARHDNAVKSKAVKDAGYKALKSGRWIAKVPLGYDMKTTRTAQTITVNKTGVLIRRAFKMKDDENLTNEEVRVRMDAMGLKLTKQAWSRIFQNVFYAGYFAHSLLNGEVVKGPHEPLVSMDAFCKINNIVRDTHSRGYETKSNKEYAPLLGSLKCPVCGYNLTSSLSTKMRKKYGREVGYYVCSHRNCKCNVPSKKANADFEAWIDGISLPDEMRNLLEYQLKKAFPILNKQGIDEVESIRTNLAHVESKIEQVEFNLATATSPKVMNICESQLEKLEAERQQILEQLRERDKEILNLDQYIKFGLHLKDNMLLLWRLSNLAQKRNLQKLIFPEGLKWNKEKDDIEPLSMNEFLFLCDLKSGNYGEIEKGQTLISEDLSSVAPQVGLEPTTP